MKRAKPFPGDARWRPAMVVFAREPLLYRSKRRLLPELGGRNTAALAAAFVEDAVRKASRLEDVRLVIAGSSPHSALASRYFSSLARRYRAELLDQGVGSLGARMARVLTPLAAAGALLIGTDTPSLPPELLAHSLDRLRRTRVLLGPSLDGGYYSIGVRGAMPNIFGGIRWGGRSVLAQTLERIRRDRVPFALGPAWYDVDRFGDVLMLATHLRLLRDHRGTGRLTHPCPATARILARLGLLGTRG